MRVTHLAALIGSAPAAGCSPAQRYEVLRKTVDDALRGVVLELVPVTWPLAEPSSALRSRSEAVHRYLLGRNGSDADQRSSVYRLALDASNSPSSGSPDAVAKGVVRLLDAKTLQPMTLAQVKPYALCGVAAASVAVAERAATAGSAADDGSLSQISSSLRRPVVGFVVVSDIGAASSLVVVSPVAGDLPSNTLLVANDLALDASFVPSVLESN
jgi:hypothetical protein